MLYMNYSEQFGGCYVLNLVVTLLKYMTETGCVYCDTGYCVGTKSAKATLHVLCNVGEFAGIAIASYHCLVTDRLCNIPCTCMCNNNNPDTNLTHRWS